ncbi:MAG: hypothetical protein K1X72_16210 [Pyrinomonadaceae bacterium]|nr:hypothetical protein [Pyrinomonadaceae bacterium]
MKNKVEKIADAILYEGYLLYPYRKSALKNQHRFNFGLIDPNDYFQTQVLVLGDAKNLSATVRFLQIQNRQVVDGQGNKVEKLEVDGQFFETWDEVIERKIETSETTDFIFESEVFAEILADGKAKFVRQINQITGRIEIEKERIRENLQRFTVKIFNLSETEKFISGHAILSVENAQFVSLLEYADEFENEVKALQQKNLFPVLIEKNIMLASPIILYDYPQVAPESVGDFYDATEIDELLTLRILTMTDAEKSEASALDSRAERILQQAEKTKLMNLHGIWRGNFPKIGQQVRLKPKKSADAFDIFLENQIAVIESIEEDFEGRKHFAVVLEADEGRDFGFDKFIGHRFFFYENEFEIL